MDLAARWQSLTRTINRLAAGRRGLWGVAVATFLESSVVPVPIELILVPAMLSHRDRAWRLATAAFVGCVLASALFYGVGWLVYDSVGQPLAGWLGIEGRLETFEQDLAGGAFWLIFAISFLPAPLQVATLGSGAFGVPFWWFMAAIMLSRFARFHGLAALILVLGKRVDVLLHQRSPLWQAAAVLVSFVLILLAGWIALRL